MSEAIICPRCQQQPPPYAHTNAAFRYARPVSDLIQRLKFNGRLEIAHLLGALMGNDLAHRLDTLPQCIIPVPLHRRRLRARGFNQALEIGRMISKRLSIPLRVSGVRRVRATLPQSDLGDPGSRQRNMMNAFETVGIQDDLRYVAVLDDVMTTGFTVAELTGTLRRAGIARVDVWVCARAVYAS